MTDPVFVFGSNLAGRHGAGAALWARRYRGAVYGVGEGMQGNSYGIPTKDRAIKTLPLDDVRRYVARFIAHARQNPHVAFRLTPVGCGLAGFTPAQIAPMFADAPANVALPAEFVAVLDAAPPR